MALLTRRTDQPTPRLVPHLTQGGQEGEAQGLLLPTCGGRPQGAPVPSADASSTPERTLSSPRAQGPDDPTVPVPVTRSPEPRASPDEPWMLPSCVLHTVSILSTS